MKARNLSPLVTVTLAIAVSTASIAWWVVEFGSRIANPFPPALAFSVSVSPVWVPLVFAGFAIGRQRLSLWMVIVLAAAQIAALAIAKGAFLYLRGY